MSSHTNPSSSDSDDSSGRLGRLFAPKAFLLALALSFVGVFLGGLVPFVGAIPGVSLILRALGLFAAAFVVGLVADEPRYVEVALAGALVGVFSVLLSTLGAFLPVAVNVVSEYGVQLGGVGAAVGASVTLVGHYFGRDLRDGVTREI
ncbi:hypothetical protein AUR64_17055 [Haloprofundus marisrubri]|uniref:Uncharacterized protein n=1 Tax=Haloprofundus marisrubri TaxID=1514971 RepID=A0A0W1R841_9EURY|nr:hypothetical protein [Haloprofundus marisrubri]KTG09481.1 hypothetical protein AUR64_17055 [Haloprofundus marisrubri]